jgi:hypothetical protein
MICRGLRNAALVSTSSAGQGRPNQDNLSGDVEAAVGTDEGAAEAHEATVRPPQAGGRQVTRTNNQDAVVADTSDSRGRLLADTAPSLRRENSRREDDSNHSTIQRYWRFI